MVFSPDPRKVSLVDTGLDSGLENSALLIAVEPRFDVPREARYFSSSQSLNHIWDTQTLPSTVRAGLGNHNVITLNATSGRRGCTPPFSIRLCGEIPN
jgi:hypothetical protein